MVDVFARRYGWRRPAPVCHKCGASVPSSKKKNSADRRVCASCTLTRYREKAAKRTPEQRQAARRRAKERAGKVYRTREEIQAQRQGRVDSPRSPFSELGRFRYYGERPASQAGALLVLRDTLTALLDSRCKDEGITRDTAVWRWRYQTAPAFRAKEKAKTAGRKATRETTMRRDGTLTPEVVRRLFATSSVCPYCDRLMRSDDKTLDHMVPVSRGGVHGIGNVTVCCYSCNSRKKDMPFDRWLQRIPPHIAARFKTVRAA